MSRILLVDDSPHAQRMAERILSEEGFEVVAVSNADSALVRLEDVDPDVVLADTVMPGRTGYEICQFIKMSPRHRHVRVILTAGVLEPFDEERVKQVEADGSLKKPFEASGLLAAVKPLAQSAAAARPAKGSPGARGSGAKAAPQPAAPFVAVVDAEQIRAAVTLALDAAMPGMVDEIARHVLEILNTKKTEPEPVPLPVLAEPKAELIRPAAAPPGAPATETVRRVTPLRLRSGSILGLDLNRSNPETPGPSD